MSVGVMSLIWTRAIPTNPKIVLLKLADHANDDGRNVYPSIERIAAECSLSERTVQRIMAELRKAGVVVVEREGGKGRGDPTLYRIDLEAVPALYGVAWSKGDTVTPLTEKKGDSHDTPAGDRVTATTVKGDSHDTKGCQALSPDSPKTIKNQSRARASDPEGSHATAPEYREPDKIKGSAVVRHVRDHAADIKHEIGHLGGPQFLATSTIPHSDIGGVFVFAVASAWAVDYGSRQFAVPLTRALKRKEVRFEIHDYAKVAIGKAKTAGKPAWRQAA